MLLLFWTVYNKKSTRKGNNYMLKEIRKQKSDLFRGDIYYADLSGGIGSEQGGTRPVLVVQNDIGNFYSPTTIVVAITAQRQKSNIPTHAKIAKGISGLLKDSIALTEQVRTVDKTRLRNKIGHLNEKQMASIDTALFSSMKMYIAG